MQLIELVNSSLKEAKISYQELADATGTEYFRLYARLRTKRNLSPSDLNAILSALISFGLCDYVVYNGKGWQLKKNGDQLE